MNRAVILISLQKDLEVIGLKLLHYHLLANEFDSRLLFRAERDRQSVKRRPRPSSGSQRNSPRSLSASA